MMVPPGRRRPARSAASIIGRPIRSLTDPPGLSISSLASSSGRRSAGPRPAVRREISTSGVLPTRSRIEDAYSMAAGYPRDPRVPRASRTATRAGGRRHGESPTAFQRWPTRRVAASSSASAEEVRQSVPRRRAPGRGATSSWARSTAGAVCTWSPSETRRARRRSSAEPGSGASPAPAQDHRPRPARPTSPASRSGPRSAGRGTAGRCRR